MGTALILKNEIRIMFFGGKSHGFAGKGNLG